MIRPARRLIGRRQATSRDGPNVPSKQRVAGSNPAGRAKKTAAQPTYRSVGGQYSLATMPVMCHIRARCFRWLLGLLECGSGGIANGIRKRPQPFAG